MSRLRLKRPPGSAGGKVCGPISPDTPVVDLPTEPPGQHGMFHVKYGASVFEVAPFPPPPAGP